MNRITWRWTNDANPVLVIEFVLADDAGFRLFSIPAWQLLGDVK